MSQNQSKIVAAVSPFKSERAAKMAYTRAEKHFDAARAHANAVRHTSADVTFQPTEEELVRLAALRAEFEALGAAGEPARYESGAFRAHCTLMSEIAERPLRAAERAQEEAFAVMRGVWERAQGQGFYIRSWHFGCNPTRDLIAANMD